MSSYNALAPFYDRLTEDVNYSAFAAFYRQIFTYYGVSPKLILDAACGTGTLTRLLAEKGYEMIGVDQSFEMLSVAAEKMADMEESARPLLLNQPLQELDLYGTVDAALCSLDGMNYIAPAELEPAFQRIHLFLEPGGVLIFDVHTPEKLRKLDGEMFLDETEDVFCVWRAEYEEKQRACFYGMDLFSRADDGLWRREWEEHVEYAHEPEALKKLLTGAGFEQIKIFGNCRLEEPKSGEERLFFAARKAK